MTPKQPAARWIAWLPISGQEDLERKLRRPDIYATKAHAFPDSSALAHSIEEGWPTEDLVAACGAVLPVPGYSCLGWEYAEPRGRCLRCTRSLNP